MDAIPKRDVTSQTNALLHDGQNPESSSITGTNGVASTRDQPSNLFPLAPARPGSVGCADRTPYPAPSFRRHGPPSPRQPLASGVWPAPSYTTSTTSTAAGFRNNRTAPCSVPCAYIQLPDSFRTFGASCIGPADQTQFIERSTSFDDPDSCTAAPRFCAWLGGEDRGRTRLPPELQRPRLQPCSSGNLRTLYPIGRCPR